MVSDRSRSVDLTTLYLPPGGWQTGLEVFQPLPVLLVDGEVPLLPLGGDVGMVFQEGVSTKARYEDITIIYIQDI